MRTKSFHTVHEKWLNKKQKIKGFFFTKFNYKLVSQFLPVIFPYDFNLLMP